MGRAWEEDVEIPQEADNLETCIVDASVVGVVPDMQLARRVGEERVVSETILSEMAVAEKVAHILAQLVADVAANAQTPTPPLTHSHAGTVPTQHILPLDLLRMSTVEGGSGGGGGGDGDGGGGGGGLAIVSPSPRQAEILKSQRYRQFI